VNCLLCGADVSLSIAYPGAEGPAARELGLSEIAVCRRCGFGRAAPCPDQARLDRFYASGSYWHGSHNRYQMAHERVQAEMRVSRCASLLPSGNALRVLDVGAGHGFIADSLARLGRVAAYDFIEPDEGAARRIASSATAFARRRVHCAAGAYDLLFLNHVLEHVADPEAFLRNLLPHLNPAALVHVETPLADYRFKPDVFPHMLFFTADAFAALGERLGVQTVAVEAFGKMSGSLLVQKLADLAFRIAVRSGSNTLEQIVDHAIWRYRVAPDGVWLRWLFRKCT
jgi:SAM-dependent methyltransferase